METISFRDFAQSDDLAWTICDYYIQWENKRRGWLDETKETRNYLFATSTRTTSVNSLPWSNSTHIPKLCQIRDNLYANYMATLFPNDKVIGWEGDDFESDSSAKRETITAYLRNKMRQTDFSNEFSKCILDFIDYGNCFGTVFYEKRSYYNQEEGKEVSTYAGPVFRRLSPLDIVFDPTSPDFASSPKIIRKVMSLGDLRRIIEIDPEAGYLEEVFQKAIQLRGHFKNGAPPDIYKNSYFQVDGFDSYWDYMAGSTVELLHFYGDIYDKDADELHRNKVITVVDRAYVIRNVDQPSWLGEAPIFHCGWRQRPDNLYAMGPLDNLVGMQYRIDHLENLKADAFDMIGYPMIKVRGYVEDFDYKPFERILVGEEGDVEFLHPDVAFLQSDNQIAMYEMKMEEMAGAPKQAMGFRTPGEKTAFEVQILDQAANKVFINKTGHLEAIFLEPIMNAMLEVGRRNLEDFEEIRIEDRDYNFNDFITVTREDITATGKIRPVGARRFARNYNMLQNLVQFLATPAGMDPSINVHFSGKRIAELVEQLLELQEFDIVRDNVKVMEAVETQQAQSSAMGMMQEQGQMPVGIPGEQAPVQGTAPSAAVTGE